MGAVFVKVVGEPIRHECVAREVSGPENGAHVVFWGLVRDCNEGRRVVAVTYDVYAPLVEKSFRDIAEEALARWGGDLRIVVIHRVGRLAVGEVSVVVGVGSPHRDEAYQASRYVIEQLKVRAPIWKQEHYVDGDSEWLEGHSLREASPAERAGAAAAGRLGPRPRRSA
jgi:molybdopterin synthase catalytic subunit